MATAKYFKKKINSLDIFINWEGLPENFENYYSVYNKYNATEKITNGSFKVKAFYLENRRWNPVTPDQKLFESSQTFIQGLLSKAEQKGVYQPQPKKIKNSSTVKLNLISLLFPGIESSEAQESEFALFFGDHKLKEITSLKFTNEISIKNRTEKPQSIEPFEGTTQNGFIRLQLNGRDFQHSKYPVIYTKTIIKDRPVPNQPYTPTIKSLYLNYTSNETISFTGDSKQAYETRIEKFFHIQPFGQEEVHAHTSRTKSVPLLPQFIKTSDSGTLEGMLYLGIKELKPKQTISLLFQILEGSGNPEVKVPPIQWSFLSNNRWIKFDKSNILSDSTKGLVKSGIIKFQIPSNISAGNTILNGSLMWLRAAVDSPDDTNGFYNTSAFPKIVNVQAQAGLAVFKDQDNDANHLKTALPADSINKLTVRDVRVEEVLQPYASFGGKLKENENDFYRRVAEHLRHKGKAITIWDYEHLVLEEFPSIYKVKTVSHHNGQHSSAPGHVQVGLIPDLNNKNAVNLYEPKVDVGTLTDVRDYLRTKVSPFIICNLHVVNPVYEQVRVSLKVRFREGFDDFGFYSEKLNQAIKQFLAPWAFGSKARIAFGGRMHVSAIIQFIELQPSVDYITDFKADHYVKNTLYQTDVKEIETITPVSVLTSYSKAAGQPGLDNLITPVEITTEEELLCPEKTC